AGFIRGQQQRGPIVAQNADGAVTKGKAGGIARMVVANLVAPAVPSLKGISGMSIEKIAEDLAEPLILAEKRGVVAAMGHRGYAVVAPLEWSESLGEIIQLGFQMFNHSRIGHIQCVFEDPIRMSLSQLGMRID